MAHIASTSEWGREQEGVRGVSAKAVEFTREEDSPAEQTGFELPVPLATGSLLLRYGNAARCGEDRRLAAKFLVKKNRVATRHNQYLYPLR